MFGTRTTTSPTIENALNSRYSADEMQAIDELSTVVDLAAGQLFVREGGVGREAIIMLTGSAHVSRGGDIIATVGPGDIVGEGALLTHEPRNASLVATSDSRVAVLNPREFASLLSRCPRLEAEIKDTVKARS